MLRVYVIASGAIRQVTARGPRGERLRPVRAGRLSAVVSEQRSMARPTERALRAHHAVVERLARELPAVVPVRFGTAFTDVDELSFVLRARRVTLGRALKTARHRVQMTLRLLLDQHDLQDVPPPDRSSGTSYLRSRAAVASCPGRHASVQPIRDAVRRWVRGERLDQRGKVVTIYHLIPRGSVAAYVRAVCREAIGARTRIRVGGPFAPYAFTGEVL